MKKRGLRWPNYFGTNDDDNITGSSGGDTIFLRAGSDVADAGDGNDVILIDPGNGSSTSANDIIDGGDGTDTLVLSGSIGDYEVSFNASGHLVLTGATGIAVEGNEETVIDVENIVFDDQVMRVVDGSGGAGSYTTIQSAVDASSEGDTVVVLDGSYSETVNMG